MQGEERVDLDGTMKVAEEDLGWEELEIREMAVEVGPKLYGLDHKKPEGKETESDKVGRLILVLLSGVESFLEKICKEAVHDQGWRVKGGEM